MNIIKWKKKLNIRYFIAIYNKHFIFHININRLILID